MRQAFWIGICSLVLVLAGLGSSAQAAPPKPPLPGAAGIGDPYFPLDGNGGYDVRHYDLRLSYAPATDVLQGTAEIQARATQTLSRFNLDLHGLTVDAIKVDGRTATWSRSGDELQVTPRRPVAKGSTFTVTVRYHGVPGQFEDATGISGGVFHTADGAIIIGQPHVASSWYPVNDHPLDKASYRFMVTVPRGLEVVANGHLAGLSYRDSKATWTWVESAPMASYLATATIGQFKMTERYVNGIEIRDAIDPVLFRQPTPRTGALYAISGGDNNGFKRLSRVINVPTGGGRLSFWVARDTEPDWDFFAVEAHPVGSSTWTTLPDVNGHSSADTGLSCPYWFGIHPFLTHYQSADDQECAPTGTTGTWNAASGESDGYEQWTVDLSPYAGAAVQVSLSVISDDLVSLPGVYVDDVVGPGGQGSTSFEADGDQLDGWVVSGPPADSPGNASDWRVAARPGVGSTGSHAASALRRQREILQFLSGYLGRYPFRQAGGIVDDDPHLGFALENQTRPIYSKDFFVGGDDEDYTWVVVHELAHQWVGDSVSVARWQDIWLNEGFASYMEWLWSESQGTGTAQDIFDSYATIPADDPFWSVVIGDPGPDDLFSGPVYDRGAMTLHALRGEIGDDAFFRLLKRWTALHADGNVTIDQFQALAERISGQNLDAFFQAWLFTAEKPAGIESAGAAARSAKVPSAVDQRVQLALKRPALRR